MAMFKYSVEISLCLCYNVCIFKPETSE